jgi:hypothetical protein
MKKATTSRKIQTKIRRGQERERLRLYRGMLDFGRFAMICA